MGVTPSTVGWCACVRRGKEGSGRREAGGGGNRDEGERKYKEGREREPDREGRESISKVCADWGRGKVTGM